ncbi:MAG: MarR family transcriptional regulator [Halanaerobium sp.]|nr:MarR family transcriptional regulator [Halanaerobium sp.]
MELENEDKNNLKKKSDAALSFLQLMNIATFFYKNCINREESRINIQRMGVLVKLFSKKGLSLKELAHLQGVSTPNLSIMIDSMVEEGLVLKEQDPEDRRKVLLNLTEDGRKKFFAVTDHLIRRIVPLMDELAVEEVEEFGQACEQTRKTLAKFSDREHYRIP